MIDTNEDVPQPSKHLFDAEVLWKIFKEDLDKYTIGPSIPMTDNNLAEVFKQNGLIIPLEPMKDVPKASKKEIADMTAMMDKIIITDPETGYTAYSFNALHYVLNKSKDGFYTLTRRKTDEKKKEPKAVKGRRKRKKL